MTTPIKLTTEEREELRYGIESHWNGIAFDAIQSMQHFGDGKRLCRRAILEIIGDTIDRADPARQILDRLYAAHNYAQVQRYLLRLCRWLPNTI